MQSEIRILALDDDSRFLAELKGALASDFSVRTATEIPEAMKAITQYRPHVLLLDMNMPEVTGLQFLKVVRQRVPDMPVLMLTGDTRTEMIVDAIKSGASDYIVKGSDEFLQALRIRIGQTLALTGMKRENEILSSKLREEFTVVFVTEVIAAVASLCLYLLWSGADTNYPLFALFCITRGAVVSFQTGSRAKIAKLLSDESYAQNSKNAIWLNKATQGATLFGGLIGYTIIEHFDFRVAIVLDGLTFLTNGFFTLFLPSFDSKPADTEEKISWHHKFKDFFKFNKQAASLDVVLAVIMMGTVAFQSRMAGTDQSWVGLYLGSFGLAVWVSGFLERGITSRVKTVPFWFLLGVCFLTLGQLQGPGPFTLAVMFIKDLSYWIIFHRISAHVQADTPATHAGSVASARAAIMITILAIGEILVGAWAQIVPVTVEASVRALIGVGVGAALLFVKSKRTVLDERPSF